MLTVSLASIAGTFIDVSARCFIIGELIARATATHSRITRYSTDLLATTIIHSTWIDQIARCSIGGKLIARSTTAHSWATSKGTDVVTAAVVYRTRIREQTGGTVGHQIVAWIASASVRTFIVVAYVMAVSILVETFVNVDARSFVRVELESCRALALSRVVDNLASLLTICLDAWITSAICRGQRKGIK